jgi:hypothetical protein
VEVVKAMWKSSASFGLFLIGSIALAAPNKTPPPEHPAPPPAQVRKAPPPPPERGGNAQTQQNRQPPQGQKKQVGKAELKDGKWHVTNDW